MSRSINQKERRARVLTRRVVTGIRVHAIPMAEVMDRDDEAAGRTPLELGATLAELARQTEALYSDYARAQEVLDLEMDETGQARAARDEATDRLYKALSELGTLSRNLLGARFVKEIKLDGATPKTPEHLLSVARAFLRATGTEGFQVPPPLVSHATLDVMAIRQEILLLAEALAQQIERVQAEHKEDQKARLERERAYDTWLLRIRFARDLARSLLLCAGAASLAQRLLPSDRQINGREPLEDDPDTSTPGA